MWKYYLLRKKFYVNNKTFYGENYKKFFYILTSVFKTLIIKL